MPIGRGDGEFLQLPVGDLDALLVDSVVPLGSDSEPGAGRGGRSELDDRAVARERPPSPVDRNEAEQAVLDLYLHLGGQILMSKGLSRRRHVDDVVDGTHPGLMSWAARSSPYLWASAARKSRFSFRSSASLARSAPSSCRSELAEARSAKGTRGRAGERWRSRSRSISARMSASR